MENIVETTIMENQMEKKMENEMESREYTGIMGNIGIMDNQGKVKIYPPFGSSVLFTEHNLTWFTTQKALFTGVKRRGGCCMGIT